MIRLYPIHLFGAFGYIDVAGRTVVPAELSWAREFSEGLGAARASGRWGYMDVSGAFVIEPQFDDAERFWGGFAVVKRGDLHGVIDRRGAWVIDPAWERISSDGGWWRVEHEGVVGWIDLAGHARLVPHHAEVSGGASTAVLLKGPCGVALLDLSNGAQVLLPCDEADRPGSDSIPARMADRWGWLDQQGKWMLPPQWASVTPFIGECAVVRTEQREVGLIDRRGRLVLPTRYRSIGSWRWGGPDWLVEDERGIWQHDAMGKCLSGPWRDTLVTGSPQVTMVRGECGWGAIDASGRTLLPPSFDELADAGEGYLFFRRGDRWGILEPQNERPVRVEARLDRPSAFHDGLAAIGELDCPRSYIDTLGREVWRRPEFRAPVLQPSTGHRADWTLTREALHRLASSPTSLFGARGGKGGHEFRLGPTLSEERVGELERAHGVTLPAEFRRFLLEVGNGPASPGAHGGAGPGHGLYEIEKALVDADRAREHFSPFRSHSDWRAASKNDEGIPPGLVVIGTNGCAYDYGLVVSGPWSGTMWSHVDPGWIPNTPAWGEILTAHHDDCEAAHTWCWEHLEKLPLERFSAFYLEWLVEALGRMG